MQDPSAPFQHSPLASGKSAVPLSLSTTSSSSAVLTDPPSGHASLRIKTDSAHHQVTLPPQPMTAGVKPPSPFANKHPHAPQQHPAPPPLQSSASASLPAAASPIVIKRNTSFSQRLHNLLHRDKSQKHQQQPPTPTAVQPRHPNPHPQPIPIPSPARDGPAIAYRSSHSVSHSTDVSAAGSTAASTNNSPPTGLTPRSSSSNLAKDNAAALPSSYYAQRNFEPVPQDKVFAVSNINLRSVQHNRRSVHGANTTVCAAPHATDSPTDALAKTGSGSGSVATEPSSSREVSREPSRNTLHQNQSAAGGHAANASSPPAAAGDAQIRAGEADGTPRPSRPSAADIADNKTRLAAGTTREPTLQPVEPAKEVHGPCTLPTKKPCPVYSTHKATLNQFGRQTKVIGKGTGGTVRLLQGADVNMRPPSLRSGPPSLHNGEEAHTYTPSEHRLFAVKEFRKRRPDETPRAYMKKVTSEFCIGSSIHQENVIETLDLIFEGDHVYEIMEYCPHDLFTFVAMGDMDLEETFCWFKQVCQGVQYLHKIGIAHRDLKLENCLLTDRGVVKIIDFGCATVFKTPFQKEPSKVVGVCGSDPYIAPEVLLSRRQIPYYAQVADIWSVGIMYMCMTLLKFPWRIADVDGDRNYGSYIREWPRGREKLFAQLPKLRHDGQKTIEGMVYPEAKDRLTMDQVMASEWMQEITVCHTNCPAASHTHRMKAQ
ncbi:serine/threonine protein kinase [Coemansia sp. Benny D115]|nr:serine/threonine protein kinase [Coemansia sp. Benny D115]